MGALSCRPLSALESRSSIPWHSLSPGMTDVTIILPTYEEKENLPLIMWLINEHLSKA